jgi:hypothetical protein
MGEEEAAQVTNAAAMRAPSPASGAAAQCYWAYLAKPTIYRIEDALAQLRVDWWPTKGRPVTVGDRVVIWRAQDKSRHDLKRGVVALGEVVGGPEIRSDATNPFWVDQLPDSPQERVLVRYVMAPNLPLWLDGPADEVLRELSVSRGQGTIFNVTPEKWDAIIDAVGGWREDAPEVEYARDLIEQMAGKQHGGQGFKNSAEARRAIERHAMERAIAYYRTQGWQVEDVSATNSYDLRCTQADGRELRVEVKGTTGDGSQVLLTSGEVRHARAHMPDVALFILAGIKLGDDPEIAALASGGQGMVYEPWVLNDDDLSALAYMYHPPSQAPS